MTTQKEVKLLVSEAAEIIKNNLTPYTAINVKGEVISYEHHSNSGIYEIEMKAKWNARGCALCKRRDHQIDGMLIVDRDKTMKFKPTWKNNAVHKTEGWIKKTNLGFVIGTFISLGSDMDD